ncbi:MAG: isoamylase early set domain-containing protein [Chloroflexota bacterium]
MLKKKFLRGKATCQVTFELPQDVEARDAYVVGEFNGWDQRATPLKKFKGVWKTTLDLEQGREFQFRYLVNGSDWRNDDAADKYVPNNVDGENSVVVTNK